MYEQFIHVWLFYCLMKNEDKSSVVFLSSTTDFAFYVNDLLSNSKELGAVYF